MGSGVERLGSGKVLSNFDLEAKLKRVKGFAGVFSIDQLKFAPKEGMGLIVNFRAASQPGTHWVAIYFDTDLVYYFDPFGEPPPVLIESFLKRYSKPYCYQNNQLQELQSDRCGMYCFYFIHEMANGVPIYSVLYKLAQHSCDANERFIQNYWGNHR
jgi:hypothetical protein